MSPKTSQGNFSVITLMKCYSKIKCHYSDKLDKRSCLCDIYSSLNMCSALPST